MSSILSVFIFLGVSIVGLFLLFILLVVLRSCIRLFIPKVAFSGIDPRSAILSAGITSLIFWDTTNLVVIGFFSSFLDALNVFNLAMVSTFSTLDDGFDSPSFAQEQVSGLQSFVPQFISILSVYIRNLSIPLILAALATFYLIANAFSERNLNGGGKPLLLKTYNGYKSLHPLKRHRFTLGISVLVGSYFCMAAILSIPWLYNIEEPSPQEELKLRVRLESASFSINEWQKRWDEELMEINPIQPILNILNNREPLSEFKQTSVSRYAERTQSIQHQQMNFGNKLDNEIGENQQEPETDSVKLMQSDKALAEKKFDEYLQNLRREIDNVNSKIQNVESIWDEKKQRAADLRRQKIDEALQAHQNYQDKNLSELERQRYQDDLVAWYRITVRSIDEDLRRFKSSTSWAERNIRRWTADTINDMRQGRLDYFLPPYIDDDLVNSDREIYRQIPPSPRDAGEVGIFGFIAQWLIDIQSYTVAVLFGMIGFGLVGSGVSRSLSNVKGNTEVLAERGTFDVILVGVTASIILFLASHGGLAIFASGETQPNAYILFLVALLGAAYGDHVWEVAREKFFEQVSREGGKDLEKLTGSVIGEDNNSHPDADEHLETDSMDEEAGKSAQTDPNETEGSVSKKDKDDT